MLSVVRNSIATYPVKLPSVWSLARIFDQGDGSCHLLVTKRYRRKAKRWPSDFLPFQWNRPEKVPGYFNSGDLDFGLGNFDKDRLLPGLEMSKEIESAPPEVRKQFTLGMNRRKDVYQAKLNDLLDRVRKHPFDVKSHEYRIAKATMLIRKAQEEVKGYNCNNSYAKIMLNTLVQKRNYLLNELYYLDKEKYSMLLDIINVDHSVPPLGTVVHRIERKRELYRLTDEYCNTIRQGKLDEYREKLKKDQVEFMKYKNETEKWIAEGETELGLTGEKSDEVTPK